MTTDTNNQVMMLWREQSRMQEQTPMQIAAHMDEIGVYLTTLHQMAAGNEVVSGLIQSTYSKLQGIMTMVSCQAMVIGSAGIIIPALKIQRDELALEMAKLLEAMGLTNQEGSAVQGLISGLYEGWRETLDTEDIESDAQEELLTVIAQDVFDAWYVPDGFNTRWLIGALRGREAMPEDSVRLFQAFLDSLSGAS